MKRGRLNESTTNQDQSDQPTKEIRIDQKRKNVYHMVSPQDLGSSLSKKEQS